MSHVIRRDQVNDENDLEERPGKKTEGEIDCDDGRML
jgi:hypothetical protein